LYSEIIDDFPETGTEDMNIL